MLVYCNIYLRNLVSCYKFSYSMPKKVNFNYPISLNHYCSDGYVKAAKYLLKIKEGNRFPLERYKDGKFLVFDTISESVLVKSGGKNKPMWMSHDDVCRLGFDAQRDAVLLDVGNEIPQFAVGYTALSKEEKFTTESSFCGKFISFRTSLFTLHCYDATIVSKAFSLIRWNYECRFCSSCGNELHSLAARTQKKCHSCAMCYYPTIKPVGLILVCKSDNSKILLVRQHKHPPGMYTCIAGFIETGENIEEAVEREVAEEVGLSITNIQYFGSQHWASPVSSLMIGCLALSDQEKLMIDSDELEDARWFAPNEVREAVDRITNNQIKVLQKNVGTWIPPSGTLAHSLIILWLKNCEKCN